MSESTARGAPESRPSPILAVDHVALRYANGALGISDVSFQVAPGEIVALLGANGAGKTSSARSAGGFLRSEKARVITGSVSFGGENVTNSEPHRQAKRGLFLVPERKKCFGNLSVGDNLLAVGQLPKRARRNELLEFVHTLFPILAERTKQLAGKLSGGQRQMLALGRAVMSDAQVICVDEMTLGLHHSVQAPLFASIKEIAATGTAVLLVDESAEGTVLTADYCYLLADGVVRDEGPASKFYDERVLVSGYLGADAGDDLVA